MTLSNLMFGSSIWIILLALSEFLFVYFYGRDSTVTQSYGRVAPIGILEAVGAVKCHGYLGLAMMGFAIIWSFLIGPTLAPIWIVYGVAIVLVVMTIILIITMLVIMACTDLLRGR